MFLTYVTVALRLCRSRGANLVRPQLRYSSGAIAGVLGAYLLLFPHARVKSLLFLGFFVTIARVPAYLLLGFWIVSQFFSHWTQALKTMPGQETGGVAYVAHIGGFLTGLLLIKLLGGRTPPYSSGGPHDLSSNPDYARLRPPY